MTATAEAERRNRLVDIVVGDYSRGHTTIGGRGTIAGGRTMDVAAGLICLIGFLCLALTAFLAFLGLCHRLAKRQQLLVQVLEYSSSSDGGVSILDDGFG